MAATWQRARLIPTSGIGSAIEAERRATSALLAVVEAVRAFSVEVFSPLGASKAQRATVECFIEVPFAVGKSTVRPDGLVRVTYGNKAWVALVEVKTGENTLEADQINAYWDIAREHGFDTVVTISNEISPAPGVHPTAGLKVRSNSKVSMHHLSWTAVLATAVMVKVHQGVDDPDQAWILGELIRYLEHPASGAMAFDDMGPHWVAVRDAARDDNLRKNDETVLDVAARWDQLLRFAALRLGSEIGDDVTPTLSRAERDNPTRRMTHLVEALCSSGTLDGGLRIPNTVGDLHLAADLRARRISAAVDVDAPSDKGARGRCSWLINQLGDVDGRLVIEAYPKNARTPHTATLADARDDKDLLIGDDKKEPHRFRLVMTREMGVARKTGKKTAGFIDSVLDLITDFYGTVVQNLTPWTPPAPKITRPKPMPEPDALDGDDTPTGTTDSDNAPDDITEPPRPSPSSYWDLGSS